MILLCKCCWTGTDEYRIEIDCLHNNISVGAHLQRTINEKGTISFGIAFDLRSYMHQSALLMSPSHLPFLLWYPTKTIRFTAVKCHHYNVSTWEPQEHALIGDSEHQPNWHTASNSCCSVKKYRGWQIIYEKTSGTVQQELSVLHCCALLAPISQHPLSTLLHSGRVEYPYHWQLHWQLNWQFTVIMSEIRIDIQYTFVFF